MFLLLYGGFLSLANSRLRKHRVSEALTKGEMRQQQALERHQAVVNEMIERLDAILRQVAEKIEQNQREFTRDTSEGLQKVDDEMHHLRQRIDLIESRLALAERQQPERPHI